MNKENCALKLVDELILYYDARAKKHQSSLFRLAIPTHKTHCWAVTRKPRKCNEDCAYVNGCIALGECLEVVINPLAPEFSFKFEHILYIKCE